MNINVIATLFDHTQNLGNSEDIITGALATAFHYCPEFTKKFFKKIEGIEFPKVGKNGYYVDTGYSIERQDWLKGITFRPDILISNKDEDWKNKPNGEQIILIESKLWANLPEKQEKSYKDFKKIFVSRKSNTIATLLISIKKIKTDAFDKAITWNQAIKNSENIHKELDNDLAEKIILEEIIELMKLRLYPKIEDFENENENICPKAILSKIKYRLDWRSLGRIKNPDSVSNLYSESDLSKIKNELNISGKTKISYLEFEINNFKYSLNCALLNDGDKIFFWIEDENGDDVKIKFKTKEINFNSQSWSNDWFSALIKIQKEITSYSRG